MDIALALGIAGFSGILLAVSLYSYIKTKVSKLLPLCVAFLIFVVKGLYFTTVVIDRKALDTPVRIALALDFVIIIMMYIAVAKR